MNDWTQDDESLFEDDVESSEEAMWSTAMESVGPIISHVIKNLPPGAIVCCRVAAINQQGQGSFSPIAVLPILPVIPMGLAPVVPVGPTSSQTCLEPAPKSFGKHKHAFPQMRVQIGKYTCAVYVKPDLTFRRVWEDIGVGRSWETQQYITARLTLKNATTSIHLTTQPLLDRVVRVGDKLIVEIMQGASVEISTGVSRIVKFFHSDIVEHVAMLAKASHPVLTVKIESVPNKVSPVPANPSGDPQARKIPTQRFSCQIMKPIAQVRESPHLFFDVKPTTMVRKNPPFARTFDLRLKEKEHYSDPTFVRTILFSLKDNAVYDVGAKNRVKPLLEVRRILQRIDLTAAKRDPDCFQNITGQHPVTEVSALYNDPRRRGVSSPDDQRGAAWRASRKADKEERHRELRLANFLFESQVPIEKDIGRLGIELTASQWLSRLEMLEITETEWTSVRNHLRSTSPEFFKRVKKDDVVVCCNSLRYTAHAFQPAAPAFLLVAMRNGMPEQRLIDAMHMIRAADQMRVSKAITALERALVQSAFSVNNAGDVGHAQRAGGRRSNRR